MHSIIQVKLSHNSTNKDIITRNTYNWTISSLQICLVIYMNNCWQNKLQHMIMHVIQLLNYNKHSARINVYCVMMILIDLGMKINCIYYHNVLLTKKLLPPVIIIRELSLLSFSTLSMLRLSSGINDRAALILSDTWSPTVQISLAKIQAVVLQQQVYQTSMYWSSI